jgi:Tfp pilus assembly pilus retraction ATPase PilT
MIKEGRTDQIRSVLQTSLREGSQTLERSLKQLIAAGLISQEEAQTQSLNPPEIRA